MRVLIIGGRGQLGTALTETLDQKQGWTFHSADSSEADLRKPETFRALMMRFRPELVINTAAYNFPDRAEHDVKEVFLVNAVGVRALADECREAGAALIHCSTNYVFDGTKKSPYRETDPPNPLNVYGLSKLAGELMVARSWERHFIIRSSGLYGFARSDHAKRNFIEQMLLLSEKQPEVAVVRDQSCTPTYCRDLATSIVDLAGSRRYGVYHITNGGGCSWAEFARMIFRLAGRRTHVKPVPSTAFPTASERPHQTVLSNLKFKRAGFLPLRPWPAALKDYLAHRPGGPVQA